MPIQSLGDDVVRVVTLTDGGISVMGVNGAGEMALCVDLAEAGSP